MSPHHDEHEDAFRSRLDVRLWKRILAHARPYRATLITLAATGALLAIVESFLPLVTGRVIDRATALARTHANGEPFAAGSLHGIWWYCGIYLAICVFVAAAIRFFIVLAGRAATGLAYDLRRAAFARLQELSFAFYDQRSVGWLMARLTSDAQRLSSVIPWTLLDTVWGTTMVLWISVLMLHLHWQLGVLVMLVIPPLAVVSLVFQRKLLRSQRLMRKTNSLLTASFNEAIMGVRTTKTLVRERESLGEFQILSATMRGYARRNALEAAVYLPIVLTLGSVGVGLALWHGGEALLGAETLGKSGLTLGMLVAFMQYAALFYQPVQEMAERFTQLQAAQASAERLQGLLDTEPAIRDTPSTAGDAVAAAGGPVAEVTFDAVSFAYSTNEPVLSEFSLQIERGETIALVGETGSGKSTIASLLCRFYEPTAGTIRVNGVDYRELPLPWLQSKLGIVLQTPHLFSGSVRDNIRYGRLTASDEEIERAARIVHADRFVAKLPQGYETLVGEGGSRLSTGQKQLLSLARAVLADPEILVLDEATSSVDTETEQWIQAGVERLLAGRISLVIAHRLSTIRSASRILVIDRGQILEMGDHATLLRRGGRYAELYRQQFTQEGADRVLAGT
jgi:ATP-binding cassette, subfamily B, bacterial